MRELRRIFVVDDDPILLEAYLDGLRDAGFTAVGFPLAVTAIQALHGERQLPDLIITDLMMPIMTGWEFCDRLTADDRLCRIPICVVSSVSEIYRPNALVALEKPVTLDALVDVVERLCA